MATVFERGYTSPAALPVKGNRQPPQGIKSIEVAGRVLSVLAGLAEEMSLTHLARAAGMPASKARRYLLSLSRIGLVAQTAASRRYSLGPLALRLGFSAFGRLDVARSGAAAIDDLRRKLNETTVLAVWNDDAPTVVHHEPSGRVVTLSVRVGSHLPILRSAVGRVFAAHLPAEQIDRPVRKELASANVRSGSRRLRTRAGVRRLLGEVRRHGVAIVKGDLVPGVSAISAPVFDGRGRIVAALAAVGRQESFDTRLDGPNVVAVKEAATRISSQLGCPV